MAKIKLLYKGEQDKPSLVFIHGLEAFVHSSGAHSIDTWRHKSLPEDNFWPHWVGEDTGCDTLVVDYDAALSAWQEQAMPLPEQADQVADLLASERSLKARPLVLIGHSMGGLVIKTMLIHGPTKGDPRVAELVGRIVAVVFIATPNAGSRWANLAQALRLLLRPNAQVGNMSEHNAHLAQLNTQFRSAQQRTGLQVKVFVESQAFSVKWPFQWPFRLGGVQFVNSTSADPGLLGVTAVRVPGDHFSICKPKDRNEQIHKSLCDFINNLSQQGVQLSTLVTASPQASRVDARRAELDRQFPIQERYKIRTAESPFPGLGHFRESDAPLFFGRADDTLKLLMQVTKNRLVIVFGQSGIGKSSLLRAGLVPRVPSTTKVHCLTRERSVGYHRQLDSLLENIGDGETVLVLDQLEEIYTDRDRGTDWKTESDELWPLIKNGLSDDHPSLHMLLSFRKEYYTNIRASLTKQGINWTRDQELDLSPLDAEGIREAVEGVVTKTDPYLKNLFRLNIDPAVTEALLADLRADASQESHIGPVLQYQLRSLWDDAMSNRKSEADWMTFSVDRYKELRRITLDDLLNEQLARVANAWPDHARSGLALDVLYSFTTDWNTAKAQNEQEVVARYSHIPKRYEFLEFLTWMTAHLRLLLGDGTGEKRKVRLAHDCLAPVIRRGFQNSDAPGQRAARLVSAKTGAVTFSESDVETIRSGLLGMEKVPREFMDRVDRDDSKYRKQRQRRVDAAIESASKCLQQLEFEQSLQHLQEAVSLGERDQPDQKVRDLALELTYPFTELTYPFTELECQRKLRDKLRETNALLGEDASTELDPNASVDRFYPPRFYPPMVKIMGGKFKMGSKETGAYPDEGPVHEVRLSNFLMSATPVTWWQFGLFCLLTDRRLPSDAGFGRGERPAINVKWLDAVDYCNWLTDRMGEVDGKRLQQVYTVEGKNVKAHFCHNGFRLPTEAEWEYAAREKGQPRRFGNGTDVADPKQMNFDAGHELNERTHEWCEKGESLEMTTPVKKYEPNALELYDMSGNVFEWCWDWWSDGETHFYRNGGIANDPTGPRPDEGERRVIRGGSWQNTATICRSSYRWRFNPAHRFSTLGFRIVRRP